MISLFGDESMSIAPGTSIWMASQCFKPVEALRVGDEVIGWRREHGHRSVVVSTVEETASVPCADLVRVTFASQKSVVCSASHKWLSGHHGKVNDDLWTCAVNRYGRGALLSHVIDVVPPLPSHLRDAACWLAGLYDGEGHGNTIAQSTAHNPDVCARIAQTLTDLGFEYTHRDDTFVLLGGLQTYVRMLAWLPITRRRQIEALVLTSKWSKYQHGSVRPPTLSRTGDRVVRVEQLPATEVVSVRTSTGNFIADGFASVAGQS